MLTTPRTLTAAALLAAALTTTLAAAPAGAQTPTPPAPAPSPTEPPPTTNPTPAPSLLLSGAAKYRVKGTKASATWPVKQTGAKPTQIVAGQQLKVVIKQTHPKGRKLTVRLAQTKPASKIIRSKTLLKGTLRFTVPASSAAAGGEFVLSVRVAGKRVFRSVLTVPAHVPPGGKPIPDPMGICGDRSVAPAATIGAVTWTDIPPSPGNEQFAPLGGVYVSAPLTNTGAVCFFGRPGATVQRFDGATWVDVPVPGSFPQTADYPVTGIGGTGLTYAYIPRDSPVGRYRLNVTLSAVGSPAEPQPQTPPATTPISVEFDYTGIG